MRRPLMKEGAERIKEDRKAETASLAWSLLDELIQAFSVLPARLSRDRCSETGLTALADLALFASIFERDHAGAESSRLANAVRSVLTDPAWDTALTNPGPEQWAIHAARAWLTPAAERLRLRVPHVLRRVDDSRGIVLTLGPPWREEEVAHVAARLNGSPMPPIRPVRGGGSTNGLYELTHVAIYATDFGVVRPTGPLGLELAAAAAQASGTIPVNEEAWDLGVELILSVRFLTGQWPSEAKRWFRRRLPLLAWRSLARLRADRAAFLHVYHPMILTALALAQAASDDNDRSEPCYSGFS